MSHWAELDDTNTVIRVTVGNNDDPDEGYQWLIDNLGGTWVKTSINSHAGKRIDPITGVETEDHFRFNYAGEGFTFDPNVGTDGAFLPPKPAASWILNMDTAMWEAPIPMPDDGESYSWDEDTQSWVPVEA